MGYSFAKTLRAIRKNKGMSQEALALACGWSGQSRIANYESLSEKSRRQPQPEEIPVIARALGVSVAELFDEAPAESRPARLDLETIRNAYQAISAVYADAGRSYDLAEDPWLFAEVYERMQDLNDPASLISIGGLIHKREQGSVSGEEDQRPGRIDSQPSKKRAAK